MLLRNTLTLIMGSGAGAVLSLVLAVLIGRATGESGLGVYASALAWVIPLALVVEFGAGTLITRTLAAHDPPHTARDLLRAAALARLILGVPLMLMLILAAPLLTSDALTALGVALSAPLVIINPFYAAFTAVFRARRAMWAAASLNTAMLTAQLTLTGAALSGGGGVMHTLIINLITSGAALVGAWALWRARFDDRETRAALSVRGLLRQAMPYGIGAALAAVQLRISMILIERLAGTEQAGYYAAAGRFFEGGRLIALAFFDALFPLLMRLAHDRARLARVDRRVMIGLSAAGLVFGAGVSLIAAPLVHLLYGDAFAPAVPVLAALGWTLWPVTLKYARGLYWYARGYPAVVNHVTALTVAAQIALGLWIVPRYGAEGAAWLSLAVEWAAVALLMAYRPPSRSDSLAAE